LTPGRECDCREDSPLTGGARLSEWNIIAPLKEILLMPNQPFVWGVFACLIFSAAGCGRTDGVLRVRVQGEVTLNGNPLRQGAVNFMPADGKGPTAGAEIKEGRYTAEVPLGPKLVQINSPKVVGQKAAYEGAPESPMMDVVEEEIPPRFNVQTILKADVSHEKREHNFKLTSP
jgi:hypothetical protein